MATVVKSTYIARQSEILVEFDCLESENPELENEITDHPVERGADITDHVRPKPLSLQITGFVSNTPVNAQAQQRIIRSQGVDITTTSVEDSPAGAVGYAENARDILEGLRVSADLLTIVTPSRVYSNMVIQKLAYPRDARTGDAMRFNMSFKEIRFAENQRSIQVLAKEPKAKKKTDIGKQVGKKTDTRVTSQLKSIDEGYLNNGIRDTLSRKPDQIDAP